MNFKLDKNLICYFCAGARNHALLDFFQEENLRSEYDERMASFKALGLAKISQAPVAICTTSGTAVSQTVSTLIEAHYSQVPLVLISGDRPKKMHGTGAPQTINHRDVTQNCVGTYVEVELEDLASLELINPEFPIHINVLINDTTGHDLKIETNLDMSDFKTFAQKISKPLFLVSHELTSLRPLVKKLLSLNLNVYAETLSGAHDLTSHLTEASLLKIRHEFDSVIRIGHTPLSKMWRLLESEHKPVFSFDARNLPGLSYGHVAPIKAASLIDNEAFFDILSGLKNSQLTTIEKSIKPLLTKYPQSELSIMKKLQDFLPENAIVYLGNSLVIRYFEMVQEKAFQVFGARGVNGIDGQIAQSIGMAEGSTEQVYCIVGDMTAQYDLNSIRHLPKNLTLFIINNGGGRIFETLKLKPIMVMEHDFSFKDISQAFGVTHSYELSQAQVIELRPTQVDTRQLLLEWNS